LALTLASTVTKDDDLAEQLAEALQLKRIPANKLVAAIRPEG